MRRREFISFLGGVIAWPSVALAQSKGTWRLGALLYSDPQSDPQMAAIRSGLSRLGYAEGRNIAIEYRYAQGRLDRLPNLAAELVLLKPNVILAIGGDVAPIAKKADDKIPLVFVSSADPEQLGLVASLRRLVGMRPELRSFRTRSLPSGLSCLRKLPHIYPRSASSGIPTTRTMSSGRLNELHKRSMCSFVRLKYAIPTISMRRSAESVMRAWTLCTLSPRGLRS